MYSYLENWKAAGTDLSEWENRTNRARFRDLWSGKKTGGMHLRGESKGSNGQWSVKQK